MWPFRSRSDRLELGELTLKVLELEQQFKVLQREQDALHASYRHLRGVKAVEARDAPRDPPKRQHGDDQVTAAPFTKDELRRKYLVVGRSRLGGNNELPVEDPD